MKARLFLLAAISFAGAALAVDPTPAKTSAPADFSSFKTADELWAHLEKLQEPPASQPKTRGESMEQLRLSLKAQSAAADAFSKTYPDDPRKWQARLVSLRTSTQLRQRFGGPRTDEDRQTMEEILTAPDASADVKGEAQFYKVMLLTEAFDEGQPATISPFHKAVGEFLEKYGSHKLAPQMRSIQLRVLSSMDSPENEALLTQIAAGKDEAAAKQAGQLLAQRARMAELKTKPVPLKFTATDGAEIDLEKMRGKVVLVDFWASWCGPCISELPNVVKTYEKLRPKGFEIVGVSLDQDQAKMEASMKKLGMTWPQHFDGKGWQNEISSSFGIRSIPAAWLVDKKGMLRETDLRGEALGAAVEKLLAE